MTRHFMTRHFRLVCFLIRVTFFFAFCVGKAQDTYSQCSQEKSTFDPSLPSISLPSGADSSTLEKYQLDFSLMERRDGASFMSWKNVTTGDTLHYKKFIQQSKDWEHRWIMYRFLFPSLQPRVEYQLEIISMRRKKTVSVIKEQIKRYDPGPFYFKELLYNIDRQIITIRFGQSQTISFTVFFDIVDFIGEE